MLGVIASSRANDPKSAQNMAVVIVIPVLSIVGIQLIGLTVFTPLKLIIMAIVIGVLDIIILRIAVSLFQRESIIVKWR
jgi:ABC-2 type transport system permease protein